ncbi:MAG: NRDE family protein [Burkholderiales bacterium]|nr:NRDE family protein [Burkholderiales bacterium]
MCLILVAWRVHAEHQLIVAANRDEFHARPAAPAGFWPDRPGILAGRDLEAKGTWLGVARGGRFAAVTNYRGGSDPGAAQSRGGLVSGFLGDRLSPGEYISGIKPGSYSGFNLLVADRGELWWLSNRDGGTRRLAPGHYALGNLLLDTPEVMEVKARFQAAPAAVEPLFSLLATAKIVAPAYGTRCASVLLAANGGRIQFSERPFDAAGNGGATRRYEFDRSG